MKNLALKAKKEEETSSDNGENDDEEDLFALITRRLERIMKMKKRYRKFKSRNKFKGKSSFQNKSNKLTCFECGSKDYLVKECPKKRKDCL